MKKSQRKCTHTYTQTNKIVDAETHIRKHRNPILTQNWKP